MISVAVTLSSGQLLSFKFCQFFLKRKLVQKKVLPFLINRFTTERRTEITQKKFSYKKLNFLLFSRNKKVFIQFYFANLRFLWNVFTKQRKWWRLGEDYLLVFVVYKRRNFNVSKFKRFFTLFRNAQHCDTIRAKLGHQRRLFWLKRSKDYLL